MMACLKVLVASLLVGSALSDRVPFNQRRSRQFDGGSNAVSGGIDFTGCQNDPDTGFCCIEKEETVTSLQKDPILECTHKNVEKCHYTYVTQFSPAQEEVCEENFEKTCQVTFKQQAFNETVKKCYKPLEKICNGQGPEECRTVYESSCTTRYIEKQPGKFVGDTSCEKLPVEICGAGCVTEEGPEECHEKVVASLVDVPEEVCDLNPQKTCRFQTKLVPSLKPKHECTIIPQEVCNLKFTQPQQVEKPLKTRWCLDPSAPAPGESYDEDNSVAPPITSRPPPGPETATDRAPEPELPTYEPQPPPSLYNANEIRSGRGRGDFFTQDAFEVPAANSFLPFRQQQRRPQNQRQQQGQRQRTGRRFGQRRQQRRQQQQRQQQRFQQSQQFQQFVV